MRVTTGRRQEGPAGEATELLCEYEADDPPAWQAGVAAWLLHCPRQSPAWHHYLLSVIHLREIADTPPPTLHAPASTHEVVLSALDPQRRPVADDPSTWVRLTPCNVLEQLELPSDEAAGLLIARCAEAVVAGRLPAEPMLAGQIEPWHSTLVDSAAHLRGEH